MSLQFTQDPGRRLGTLSWMIISFVFAGVSGWSQTPTVFARVVYQKVEQGKEQEFLTMLRENWKPAHKVRQQNGKITGWAIYRVHFTGAGNEYNYVTVSYHDSWEKTEVNDNYTELIKAANPKADAAAILAKTLTLRSIVKQELYSRNDITTAAASGAPARFFEIDFMKVKEGQGAEYVKVETEVWKPIHQAWVNDGKRSGWALWSLVFPSGSNSTYDFATSNGYSSYKQIGGENYEEAFKKVHPGKDMQGLFNSTEKTRNLVRRELWELVDSL